MNEKKNKVVSFFQQLRNSNRHLLIVGLGVTGKTWVNRLKLENINHSIVPSLTSTTDITNHLNEVTDLILSPGIPRSLPFIRAAIKKNITVWSEIDFLYPLFKHFTTIAITGTDGKTSTLTLTHHLISHGLPLSTVLAGGNNGTPIISLIDKFDTKNGILILEFSSYMLEELHQFRANYNIVLNIAPDHLDRYQDFQHYAATKYQLLKYITPEDHFIVNLDHKITAEYLNQHFSKLAMKKIFIGKFLNKSADYTYDKNFFYLKNKEKIPRLKTSNLKPIAPPSTYSINILASIAFADLLGVPPNKINKLLPSFQGLEHRLELLVLPIKQQSNLMVINDSKATTLQATIKAVETCYSLDKLKYSIHLILGGQNKGISFTPLKEHLAKLAKIYFYGQDGEEIKYMLFGNQEAKNTCYHYSLSDITKAALKDLTQNNSTEDHTPNSKKVLLFSPACSSFDQFDNYYERGSFFKQQIISFFKS